MARVISLLIGLLTFACSSAAFDGTVYRSGELAFRVGPVPEDWQLIEADHTLLAFRDRSGGATIAVNGRCGKDGDDVPLESLTHHLFLHFTERQVAGQSKLALDGRDALRTVLLAKLDGVPKHFTVVVLKKNGCVYDFLRIGHDGSTVQDFDGFVRGFSTLS